ncbi:serine/threonine-protein kinase [Microcoleus sp. FACHB-68]|uniref:serine/threonine protein kinase n=1 Tax=Microcoleus sp. FACHB-68 TaxID=2692826 RepID=UPI0016887320|nr:serine/threonine-protein kinase [Microcoleus sp. FACHB-68]MBD1936069.1 serine/threonine protein kinase [Microcoleus sp. FACHB-68]
MLQAQQILQGRYQLHRQLGHNAGRQTWLAKDLNAPSSEASLNAAPVIVKLLAFSPQMQWEELKLFEREAQVLKQLNHVKIPQYRDYFSIDKEMGAGLHWFALVHDYIPGSSLQQILDRGERFTESQVRSIATGILEILIYLHELNPPVLHRDIKPSNLIWGKDKQIYLVDFGAVQDPVAAEGVTFTVVGSAGYAPLEQFWGRAVPASDLYALGATLIHLLTGTAPADLPQNNLRIQFRDRVSLNSTFISWIETLTQPDLNRRFSTASQALEALKTGKSLHLPLPTIPQPAGSRVKLSKSSLHLGVQIPKSALSFYGLIKILFQLILTVGFLPFQLLLGFLVFFGLISLFASGLFSITLSCLVALPILFAVKVWIDTTQEIANLQNDFNTTLLTYWGQQELDFYKNQFKIEEQLFGFGKNRSERGKISEIKKITAIPSQGVIIETQNEQYLFGKHLSKPEVLWLAQEVEEWVQQAKERQA